VLWFNKKNQETYTEQKPVKIKVCPHLVRCGAVQCVVTGRSICIRLHTCTSTYVYKTQDNVLHRTALNVTAT